LSDEEYFQEKKQMVVATRERTKEELRRRGFEVLDSSANFLFAKPNSVDAGWLFEELKKEGMWFVCADMDGQTMYDLNLTGPIGLVIGNEGAGVSRPCKRKM